jgi:hypothetical protein
VLFFQEEHARQFRTQNHALSVPLDDMQRISLGLRVFLRA